MAGMQDKDIYKRPYVRPNENWVCGLAADGRPCPHGPTKRGKCAVHYECKPAKVGERWVCTRPEQYGGPCDAPSLPEPSFGPLAVNGEGVCCRKVHCTPQRSLRAKRGRLSVILCSLIAGIVLLSVGGPWRDSFFSPGPLTAAHQGASMASLEDMSHGKVSSKDAATADSAGCHTCHTVAEGGLAGMLKSALSGEVQTPQSQQCLACHSDDIGESALFTHALDPDTLNRHTGEAKAEPFRARRPVSLALASLSPGVKTGNEGQLACAGCHREHNGALFDLKRLDNQQCQSCHVKQFKSLGSGHPEFSTLLAASGYDYPYRRRTRIIYDHASHETDYFKREENLAHAPADCMACHDVGDGARNTALKPFETMCAACHTNNIVAGRDEWIHVFGFPSMEFDAYDVVEEETETKNVPRTARKGLSPFMFLLQSALYADDEAAEATFLSDLDMVQEFAGDLSGIVFDEDPEIVARLIAGSSTVYERSMDGDAGGFRQAGLDLLARVRGGAVDPAKFDAMFGFPEPGDTVADVAKDLARRDIVEMSGWHMAESGYRLDGSGWSAALAELEPYAALKEALDGGDAGPYAALYDFFSSYSDFKDWFDANLRIEGEDWVLIESGEEAKKKDWEALLAKVGKAPAAEDAEEPAEGSEAAEEETEADTESEAAEPESGLSDAGDEFVKWVTNVSKVKRWIEDNFDTSGSTWTLRAPQSLYYRPVQHADPFLTAWIDFSAELYTKNRAAAMVFDQLTGRREGLAIGACAKCHSIDVEEGILGEKTVRVNWKSMQPQRTFTTFNHSPHLKLMDCAQCHRAPWIPAISERVQIAKAASAEEESPAANAAVEETAPEESPEAIESEATPQETPEAADSTAEETTQPEVEADTQAEVPADEPSGDPVEDTEPETAAEDGAEAVAQVARPEISYIDSFKVEKGGLEIGVNFSNRDHDEGYAFTSSFEPITKDECARCHMPGKAGDSCLICHNYHIKSENWSAGVRSLSELLTFTTPAE